MINKFFFIKRINFYLFIVLLLFILVCSAFTLILPIFEAPDEPGHFLYAFYISKYNKIPLMYNESIPTSEYIRKNLDKDLSRNFYTDNKYMFYKIVDKRLDGTKYEHYRDQRHHPPLYYLISSLFIKKFNNLEFDLKDNFKKKIW